MATAQQLLSKFQFDNLPQDRTVFWAHGGTITDSDERRIFSLNQETKNAFLQIEGLKNGFRPIWIESIMRECQSPPAGVFVDLNLALGCDDKYDPLITSGIEEISFWERKDFWRNISTRFAQKAEGVITVAVSNAQANTNFRLFEYPVLMANERITHMRVLETQVLPSFREQIFVHKPSGKIHIIEWGNDDKPFSTMMNDEDMKWITTSTIYKDNPVVMAKQDWSAIQKQQWFDNAVTVLQTHLDGKAPKLKQSQSGHQSRYHQTPVDINLMAAQERFLGEAFLCLREANNLTKLAKNGEIPAQDILKQEQARLVVCRDIIKRYPIIISYGEHAPEQYTHPEWVKAARSWKELTQELGQMLIRMDDNLTIGEKNTIWGRYQDYNRPLHLGLSEYLGQPKQVEEYVRQKLAALPIKIDHAIDALESLMPVRIDSHARPANFTHVTPR